MAILSANLTRGTKISCSRIRTMLLRSACLPGPQAASRFVVLIFRRRLWGVKARRLNGLLDIVRAIGGTIDVGAAGANESSSGAS